MKSHVKSLFSSVSSNVHKRLIVLSLLLIVLTISACSNSSSAVNSFSGQDTELTISAAASLADSLQEIKQIYEQKFPNVTLTFNFAASGTLQKQIEQGAPADLFFSAGTKQMQALVNQNLINADRQLDLLRNELVLVVPKDSSNTPTSIADLNQDSISRLAVGTPESVPAGMYTKQSLEKLGLWESLQPKIVQTKDVAQVLSYVETGNADAGFVYKTDALTSDKVKIAFTTSEDSHEPIVYPLGVIAATTHREEAAQFYAYLQTEEAKAVFTKYGFNKVVSGS